MYLQYVATSRYDTIVTITYVILRVEAHAHAVAEMSEMASNNHFHQRCIAPRRPLSSLLVNLATLQHMQYIAIG